jgi:hypothetical protein
MDYIITYLHVRIFFSFFEGATGAIAHLNSFFIKNKYPRLHSGTGLAPHRTDELMSTHASVLVDSVGSPSEEVCRTAASFP